MTKDVSSPEVDTMQIPSQLNPLILAMEPVGSRVTCNPPPTDTDQDYLALVKPGNAGVIRLALFTDGWQEGGSFPCDDAILRNTDTFLSYTKGQDNLIITADKGFFSKFMAATSVAKRFNLMDKSDRIALFQAVLYGNKDNA